VNGFGSAPESIGIEGEIAQFLATPVQHHPFAYNGNMPTRYVDPSGLLFGGTVDAGEGFGEFAAQYWADLAVQTGNPLYNVPGALASLWTRKTSDVTVAALSLGYNVGLWNKYGLELVFWRYPNAGGGGINILQQGERMIGFDWHRFKSAGELVFRPHIDIPGIVKHWPWK
jgi:hypothetical protein